MVEVVVAAVHILRLSEVVLVVEVAAAYIFR